MIDRENNADRLEREAAGLEYPPRPLTDDDRGRLARLERRVSRLESRRGWLGRIIDLVFGRRAGQ